MKTRFLPAYDTEQPNRCLPACKAITAVHERFGAPGTFFIVGRLLESVEAPEYRTLLGGSPLYEVASHTYSHKKLAANPIITIPIHDDRRGELRKSKDLVEQTFGRPCPGFRPAFGFAEGLHGDRELVDEVAAAGYRYVSARLWGPETTLPALLVGPETYAAEGHPELWEMPGHGWHENGLKATNLTTTPRRIILWPMPMPEVVPPGPIKTPEEEFAINRIFMDRAVELGLPYVTFIWHPWSLHQFDPAMRMLELTFQYARDIGMELATFSDEWKRISAGNGGPGVAS
jgi:peptidoglycan/xylan/chitin deacetylase (PgdA/CDA1 family)